MATFTSKVDGTFSLEEIAHLASQVGNLPSPFFGDRYIGYQDAARRRFKGSVSITVEEVTPTPAPSPEEAT